MPERAPYLSAAAAGECRGMMSMQATDSIFLKHLYSKEEMRDIFSDESLLQKGLNVQGSAACQLRRQDTVRVERTKYGQGDPAHADTG
jgi:hypothetical protein